MASYSGAWFLSIVFFVFSDLMSSWKFEFKSDMFDLLTQTNKNVKIRKYQYFSTQVEN